MDIKNVLENTRKWQRDWVPNKITVQEETQFSTPTEEFFQSSVDRGLYFINRYGS
jgi:hypothetical protein